MPNETEGGIIQRNAATTTAVTTCSLAGLVIVALGLEGAQAGLVAAIPGALTLLVRGLDSNGGLVGLVNRILHGRPGGG